MSPGSGVRQEGKEFPLFWDVLIFFSVLFIFMGEGTFNISLLCYLKWYNSLIYSYKITFLCCQGCFNDLFLLKKNVMNQKMHWFSPIGSSFRIMAYSLLIQPASFLTRELLKSTCTVIVPYLLPQTRAIWANSMPFWFNTLCKPVINISHNIT